VVGAARDEVARTVHRQTGTSRGQVSPARVSAEGAPFRYAADERRQPVLVYNADSIDHARRDVVAPNHAAVLEEDSAPTAPCPAGEDALQLLEVSLYPEVLGGSRAHTRRPVERRLEGPEGLRRDSRREEPQRLGVSFVRAREELLGVKLFS